MANGIEVAKAYVTIVPSMEGSQQTITEEMSKAAAPAGEAAGKAAGKSYVDSFGQAASNVGKTMTAAITAPIVGLGTAAVKKAATYEEALAKVSTIADQTVVPIDQMGEAITALSSKTGVAAADIAESVYNAISAGQDTADAVSFVESALSLSRAGFTDAANATDVLTTALNAYGLEADQVTHISDVLIGTQNMGKTTVDELAHSLGKVIPTAKAAGIGIEDLATQYVALTKNGIATAEATTYINSAFNELSKTGSKADKEFRAAAGVSFPEYIQAGNSVSDALKLLKGHAEDAGLAMGDMFGSAEAAKAANVIADFQEADETLQSLKESTDVTAAAVAKVDSTALHQYQVAQQQVNNLLIKLGSDILPMITPLLERAVAVVDRLSGVWDGLSEPTKELIIKTAGIAAAAGPVLLIFGKLSTAASKVGGLFGGIAGKIGGAGKAAGAAGKAAGAGAAGFGSLAGEGVKLLLAAAGFVAVAYGMSILAKAAIEMGEAGKDAWISLGIMTGAIVVLMAAAAIAGPALTANAVGIGVFGAAVLAIGAAVALAAPAIGELIEAAGRASINFAEAGTIISTAFCGAVDAVAGGIDTVVSSISNGLATVLDSIAGIFDSLGESALNAGEGFATLADGLIRLTNETGVIDLGNTLLAVATGLGAIMAEAALGGNALESISGLGASFLLLATNAQLGCEQTIASITMLRNTIASTRFDFPQNIKLPHFTATAGVAPYGAGGGTPPTFSVRWYDKGGIFDHPAIIGVGEKRPEFVGALDDLRSIVREESGARTINHTGTIRVEGYNSRGEFDAVIDNLVDRLRAEARLA